MAVDRVRFRDLLRCFASGVTVVTAGRGERVHGMTVSAFASVSAEPPLVLIVIDRRAAIHEFLAEGGPAGPPAFAVNILAADQEELSRRFAAPPDVERFAAGSWSAAATGAPILTDALAWLDCTVVDRRRAGDHVIYVGRVESGEVVRPEAGPLVYWDRGYRRLSSTD
jgi:flavin reductase (DIM6/NTAB) family NADH-FMN oxidoreductase RutF